MERGFIPPFQTFEEMGVCGDMPTSRKRCFIVSSSDSILKFICDTEILDEQTVYLMEWKMNDCLNILFINLVFIQFILRKSDERSSHLANGDGEA